MSTNVAGIAAGQLPLRAFSLAALHNRTAVKDDPELVLAWTPLAQYAARVLVEGTVSEVRGQELHANLTRWSGALQELGLPVIAASFRPGVDEPASDMFFFDERDSGALQEALATPLAAAGIDPAAMPCILVWRRASPETQLELVSVRPYIQVSAEIEVRLLAAGRRWYELRRAFFAGMFDLVVETDPDRYWGRLDLAGPPVARHHEGGVTLH